MVADLREQTSLRLRQRKAGKMRVDEVRNLGERLCAGKAVEIDDPVLDIAVRTHEHGQRTVRAERHQSELL